MRFELTLANKLQHKPNLFLFHYLRAIKANCSEIDTMSKELADTNPLLAYNYSGNSLDLQGYQIEDHHPSLKEFLLNQWNEYLFTLPDTSISQLDKKELLTLTDEVIDCIDSNGYIKKSSSLTSNPEIIEHVQQCFSQSEYPGIGAIDLKSCLLLQIQSIQFKNSKTQTDLFSIIRTHLGDIANKKFTKILQSCSITDDELLYYLHIISSLNPKPAASLSNEDTHYITPDFKLSIDEDKINLEPVQLSSVCIDDETHSILAQSKNINDQIYLNQKFKEANNWIQTIEKRNSTLFNVTKSVVTHQFHYLSKRKKSLSPLSQLQISKECDVHKSTVSRIINNKYIELNGQIICLSKLFCYNTGFIKNEYNKKSELSTQDIEYYIRSIIKKESLDKPLSDTQVAAEIRTFGIDISRRTITKYRLKLGIPTSFQRKRRNACS